MKILKVEVRRYSGDSKSANVAEIVVVSVFTDGGVMHWHGAAPDEPLVMIAVQGGGAEWGNRSATRCIWPSHRGSAHRAGRRGGFFCKAPRY